MDNAGGHLVHAASIFNEIIMGSKKVILASQSPRRRQLLEWAEIPFDVIVKETDESYPSELSVEEIAIHIASNKAKAIASDHHHDIPVIAADTIVVLDNKIIGKPNDRADALQTLASLSGREHRVITGVVIAYKHELISFADVSYVDFHELTLDQIAFYVDKYKPYDKAGAYAIQEWIGVVGIKSIKGDFYNVMGLPVSRVVKALESLAY